MKVYEMLQALEIVNQLNNALGQNEQCLKIYISSQGETLKQLNVMSLKHYFERCESLSLDEKFYKAIACSDYNNDPVKIKHNEFEYEIEIYTGYEWEIDD